MHDRGRRLSWHVATRCRPRLAKIDPALQACNPYTGYAARGSRLTCANIACPLPHACPSLTPIPGTASSMALKRLFADPTYAHALAAPHLDNLITSQTRSQQRAAADCVLSSDGDLCLADDCPGAPYDNWAACALQIDPSDASSSVCGAAADGAPPLPAPVKLPCRRPHVSPAVTCDGVLLPELGSARAAQLRVACTRAKFGLHAARARLLVPCSVRPLMLDRSATARANMSHRARIGVP